MDFNLVLQNTTKVHTHIEYQTNTIRLLIRANKSIKSIGRFTIMENKTNSI